MCPRCEGFWIGASVLELSNRRWPAGPKVWWRNELGCPDCATTGVATVMNARECAGVIIDQCAAHGVWFDRGELSRVMRDDPALNDLDKLRENLAALEPSPEVLQERRERWHAEQEERARLAEIERRRIESERVKRVAEDAAAEKQRADERQRLQAEKVAQAERLAAARQEQSRRIEEENRAAEARALEARKTVTEPSPPAAPQVVRPREDVQAETLQDFLADERARTLARLERERDAARKRIDFLEARIDSIEHELVGARRALGFAREEYVEAEKAYWAAKDEA
jgi:Zn-finger nucleic acid-binding protein